MVKFIILLFLVGCGADAKYVDTRTVPGAQGVQGDAGAAGKDGTAGKDGVDGKAGSNGTNGKDGVSCVIASDPNGAIITCAGASVFIRNGAKGAQGPVGPAGPIGPAGADANALVVPQTINFYGTVCNGLYILGIDGGPKFVSYGSQVFVLTTTVQIIWQNTNPQYCKLRLDTKGAIVQDYKP